LGGLTWKSQSGSIKTAKVDLEIPESFLDPSTLWGVATRAPPE
jgi:hypothetical protein